MNIPTIERFGDKACVVSIGDRRYYFSYETCVAFSEYGKAQIRREKSYSATTSRHMDNMAVLDWTKVDDATFEQLAGVP